MDCVRGQELISASLPPASPFCEACAGQLLGSCLQATVSELQVKLAAWDDNHLREIQVGRGNFGGADFGIHQCKFLEGRVKSWGIWGIPGHGKGGCDQCGGSNQAWHPALTLPFTGLQAPQQLRAALASGTEEWYAWWWGCICVCLCSFSQRVV